MAAATQHCEDFDGPGLRVLAKATKDDAQGRRLLAVAEIYDCGTRSDAARIGGVGLYTVRDRVLRKGPDGLLDRKAPGAAPLLTNQHRRALAEIVESGPTPAIYGVVRWRRKDLALWLQEEFGLAVRGTLSRSISKHCICATSFNRCAVSRSAPCRVHRTDSPPRPRPSMRP